MEAIHLLLVMPGLDPGTATTAGIRGDHRVKPGDDDGRYRVSDKTILHRIPVLIPMGLFPAPGRG
jgi:hypothetical protein